MKIPNSIIILFSSLLIFSLGSCNKINSIHGNGQIITETRPMISFDKVENQGTFNVFIIEDSVFTVSIEAESNLVPYIRTMVNGNTLIIDTKENLDNNYSMNVFVRTPTIHGATLSGSGYITLDSLVTDNMNVTISGSGGISGEVETTYLQNQISGSGNINLFAKTVNCDTRISGSGSITLTGEGSSGNFTISGSGQIRSTNFPQKECIAKISGSGDMYLNVSDFLSVVISGSGSVFYIGNPSLNINVSGSGNVIKQ